MDAGLTWIGPPPEAIEKLGDKVSARHIAQKAGTPLVAGTKDPVASSDEVVDFAREHGLPIAIKAAFGGRSEERRVGKSVELGGRRIIRKGTRKSTREKRKK